MAVKWSILIAITLVSSSAPLPADVLFENQADSCSTSCAVSTTGSRVPLENCPYEPREISGYAQAASQDSHSESTRSSLELVGEWVFGPCCAVTTVGDIAYFGDGDVLDIVDFSQPASPVTLARLRVPGHWIVDICVSGDYAYVSQEKSGLHVIDVSNPTNPIEIGSYVPGGTVRRVAVSGSIVYVVVWEMGLRVLDVSDPAHPTEIGSYDTNDPPVLGVALSGHHAYLANDHGGLRVFDVSDPANPISVGHLDTQGAGDVVVRGDYAYVADGSGGFLVVDVSDPTNPVQLGHRAGACTGLAVSGDYAYLVTGDLWIVDVSDPTQPRDVASSNPTNPVYDVAVSGSYVFVANYVYGLYVLDASDPSQLRVAGTYDTGDIVCGVDAVGSLVYVAERYHGLRVIDVADPTRPRDIGVWNTPGESNDVRVMGNIAYVADSYGGLRIIDVSAPTHPVEVGFFDPEGFLWDVAVSDNLAYVTDAWQGLRVIDVSDPAAPVQIGFFELYNEPSDPMTVAIAGNYAYLAYGYYGLWLLDVSDPTNPIELDHTNLNATDVAIAGEYAYVVDKGYPTSRFSVFEIGRPFREEVGSTVTRQAGAVVVSGQYAYVAAGGALLVMDVSDPTAPIEVDSYTIAAGDVDVFGNQVYTTNPGQGFFILRHSPPSAVTLQSLEANATSCGIRISWSVSDEGQISEYKLYRSLPESDKSVLLARLEPAADGKNRYEYTDADVRTGPNYRYALAVVEEDGAECVLGWCDARYDLTSRLTLGQNIPNPFNPETVIQVDLPEPMKVELVIYDIKGRVVAWLADGFSPAGTSTYRWNGRDTAGEPVVSGVYVYQLRAGKETISRKMVLLR